MIRMVLTLFGGEEEGGVAHGGKPGGEHDLGVAVGVSLRHP